MSEVYKAAINAKAPAKSTAKTSNSIIFKPITDNQIVSLLSRGLDEYGQKAMHNKKNIIIIQIKYHFHLFKYLIINSYFLNYFKIVFEILDYKK